jgi:hypothetical protein
MTPSGVYDATTDEAVMRNWRTKCPEANIGIATGARRGLLVVDIDPRNGGDESITELEQQHGALATSALVSTGGGGQHRLFRHPTCRIPAKLAPGIDVKSDGGYIVAAPSQHESGRRNRWQSASIPRVAVLPDLPDWALKVLSQKPDSRQSLSRGTKKPSGKASGTRDRTSRHWWMINELSRYGIRKVRHYSSLAELTVKLHAASRKIEGWFGSPKGPLPDAKMARLVEQPARSVWKHRFDEKRNRFAMKLGPRVWVESYGEYRSDVRHRQQLGERCGGAADTQDARQDRARRRRITCARVARHGCQDRLAHKTRQSDSLPSFRHLWQRSLSKRRSAPALRASNRCFQRQVRLIGADKRGMRKVQ